MAASKLDCFQMRGLGIVVVALALVVTSGVDSSRAAASGAGGCAVKPTPGQWSAARLSFREDFVRIRRYLIAPSTANQARMYARVDFALFQYYSWAGGVLNANEGKASGHFTLQFKSGSQCFDKKTISFRVLVHASFTSTNHHGLNFSRLAHVEMKVPRITRYMDRVIR
jgi:hypothetical protein